MRVHCGNQYKSYNAFSGILVVDTPKYKYFHDCYYRMELYCILYTSQLLQSPLDSDLFANKNSEHNITGVLYVTSSDTVIQYIEGPSDPILQLWTNIRRDPSHNNIITLFIGIRQTRAFTSWMFTIIKSEVLPQSKEDEVVHILEDLSIKLLDEHNGLLKPAIRNYTLFCNK